MAKIELPESWASVAEPLRALMAEVEREAHADRTTPQDLAAVSAPGRGLATRFVRWCARGAPTRRPRKHGSGSSSARNFGSREYGSEAPMLNARE